MHRRIRAHIYACFRDTTLPPTVESISRDLELPARSVRESLEKLAGSHAIVLRPDTHEIWMAHPFSGVPTDYTATSGDRTWFANCGWDAVAILALLGNGTLRSKDPLTSSTNEWTVSNGQVRPAGVVHFLVPARKFWDDIGFT